MFSAVHQDADHYIGERDYLLATLKSENEALATELSNITTYNNLELEKSTNTIRKLELERDTARSAQVNAGDHAARAQNLAHILVKHEKITTSLRHKHLEEQLKVTTLEDEVESLKARGNQESINELKEQLRKMSSQYDRQCNQLKLSERLLVLSQGRVMKITNDGDYLRGAAHLVAPNEKGKLPTNVMPCSECYAKSLTCDSSARCRSCTDGNAQCARWRCSLKHKLGECPLEPCKLPHDSQGWLVLLNSRPQW